MRRTVRLKGLKYVTKASGQRYVYRRVAGRLIPLPLLPENHPDFLAAYVEAGNAKPVTKHAGGTIGALIVAFLGSHEYRQRADSTRAVWRRRLDHMSEAYGKGRVVDLRPEHIRKAIRQLTPGAARSERTIWRALLAYAVEHDWRPDNPALTVTNQKYQSTPHAAWSLDDVEAFREHWPVGTGERQAMEVLYWSAARCVDAVNLGWQRVEDGVLTYTQAKTGGEAVFPVTAPVDTFLAEDQAHFLSVLPANFTWILTQSGKPRSVKGLSQAISRAAKAAGLEGRTAHGLRKSRAAILAQGGWTPHRIGAWTGHESLSEIAHYTRSVDRKGLVLRTEQDRNSGNRIATVSKFRK